MRSYSMNIEKKNLKVAARREKIRLRRERKKKTMLKNEIVVNAKNEVENMMLKNENGKKL